MLHVTAESADILWPQQLSFASEIGKAVVNVIPARSQQPRTVDVYILSRDVRGLDVALFRLDARIYANLRLESLGSVARRSSRGHPSLSVLLSIYVNRSDTGKNAGSDWLNTWLQVISSAQFDMVLLAEPTPTECILFPRSCQGSSSNYKDLFEWSREFSKIGYSVSPDDTIRLRHSLQANARRLPEDTWLITKNCVIFVRSTSESQAGVGPAHRHSCDSLGMLQDVERAFQSSGHEKFADSRVLRMLKEEMVEFGLFMRSSCENQQGLSVSRTLRQVLLGRNADAVATILLELRLMKVRCLPAKGTT
jgi:hypothetical protein